MYWFFPGMFLLHCSSSDSYCYSRNFLSESLFSKAPAIIRLPCTFMEKGGNAFWPLLVPRCSNILIRSLSPKHISANSHFVEIFLQKSQLNAVA